MTQTGKDTNSDGGMGKGASGYGDLGNGELENGESVPSLCGEGGGGRGYVFTLLLYAYQ